MAKLLSLLTATLLLSFGASAGASLLEGKAMLGGKSSGAENVVVYLEGGAPSTPLPHAMIDQRNKMFLPHVTVVTKGTKVDFPNHDTVFHNVFAFYQAKKFDLGMYPQGASKSVTFDKTGEVVLLCSVHSDMSAFILVVDTPYYAVSGKSGAFHIANVPPGHYILHAWHESGAAATQPVDITDSNAPLAVSLTRK